MDCPKFLYSGVYDAMYVFLNGDVAGNAENLMDCIDYLTH